MQYQVRPLREDLPYGIRITGLTQDILRDEVVRNEIDALFLQHGMIIFEDVENSDAMQLALSSCFGPLKEHPVKAVKRVDTDRMPGVVEIASDPENAGVVEIDGKALAHWLPWHFDHCYNDELNRAGVLRAVEIVEEGGLTGFVDGVALYKAFPKDLLERIENKTVLYTLSVFYDELRFGKPENYKILKEKPAPDGFNEQANAMRRALHPAIWTTPLGEKCLHVSPYMADGIHGMENAEGEALLEEICQTTNAIAEKLEYRHKWKPSDMLIWDNTRMLHAVSGNNPEDVRRMYRTTISGDYGLGSWDVQTKGGQILEPA